jgi:hypothetical protein
MHTASVVGWKTVKRFDPRTAALWTVVNERNELGPNLVTDYLTSVKSRGFYGWPYSYFGRHLDPRVHPQRPDLVEGDRSGLCAELPRRSPRPYLQYRLQSAP